MRLIPIECVRKNSYLGKTIYDDYGKVLLKKGIKLTESIIKSIYDQNIFSVYIEDEYSEEEINEIIKPELRQKFVSVIKETFNEINKIVNVNNEAEKSDMDYFNHINNIAEELINSVLSNKDTLINLVDIKSMDNYTYQHSVNVAVISIVIGFSLQMSREELIDLTLGALIHDIGKAFIPKETLESSKNIYSAEDAIFKEHPIKGFEYLETNYNYSDRITRVVLEHHERIDGQGYPKGLKGNEISKNARIIAIADAYDRLTSDGPYSRAICANDALEFIMAHASNIFDFELVKIFAKAIVAYPEGTIVKLSNGDIGIVNSTPINYPLRPKIRIIKSKESSNIGKVLNLVEELSITIINVEYYV